MRGHRLLAAALSELSHHVDHSDHTAESVDLAREQVDDTQPVAASLISPGEDRSEQCQGWREDPQKGPASGDRALHDDLVGIRVLHQIPIKDVNAPPTDLRHDEG